MKTIPVEHPRDLVKVLPLGTKISSCVLQHKWKGNHGTVGRQIEQYISAQTGLKFQKVGPDLKIGNHYCEVKTRQIGCQSAVCLGTTSTIEISESEFENTGLYKQLEFLYYIWYDSQGFIVDTGVFNLEEYRGEVGRLFNKAKISMLLSPHCKYVTDDDSMFYLESSGSSVFQLRCSERKMRKLQKIIRARPRFKEFFDIE
jgi:hypothetical protein